MSVGHSRRTSRKPSREHRGRGGQRLLEVALDPVLLEAGRLAHLVLDVREHLVQPDLEPVLARAGALANDDQPGRSSSTIGGVIQFSGLYPPASAWTRTEPSAFRISSRVDSGR